MSSTDDADRVLFSPYALAKKLPNFFHEITAKSMSRITLSSQPFAPNFFKKPSAVLVTFASCDGAFNTLEGKVLYAAADALMTGVLGEHWPIRRLTFESSYEACDSQPMGVDGHYRKRPIPVFARQLTHSCVITLDEARGELNGKPGDWILKDASGRSWVVANDVFQITYAALVALKV